MQNFDWALMQTALAVADSGTFSGAARLLGISQPTVGRHVQELERQLGIAIFQPTAKGFDLTTAGVEVIETAMDMRTTAARISLVAEGKSEDVSGTVRITASEIVATYILPRILAQLLHQEPQLQIELVATNSSENLSHREADIAVRMVGPEQPDLISKKLGELTLGIYAARSYLDAYGIPETVQEALQHRFLGYDKSDLIIKGMEQQGVPVTRESFAFRCDDHVAYMQSLIAGVGIGTCQTKLASDADLVRVLGDVEIPSLPVWLTAHRELRTSAKVRRVFDFLSDGLAEELKSS